MWFGRKYARETRGYVRRWSKVKLGEVAEGYGGKEAENKRAVAEVECGTPN